jgi:hypothetical protein
VRRPLSLGLLLGMAGCSNLTGGSGTPVAIEIRFPAPPLPNAVEPNDPDTLHARALDRNGDSVAATIIWQTADTAKLILDTLTGIAMARPDSTGTVRVQARNDGLTSDFVTLTIGPHSDTLKVVSPDSFRVQGSDSVVGPIVVQLRTTNPDSGVAGATLIYRITLPVYPALSSREVELPGGVLTKVIATDTSGGPVTGMTLRRLPTKTWPDSVMLLVGWTRPSGTPVPGSPHVFVIRFK